MTMEYSMMRLLLRCCHKGGISFWPNLLNIAQKTLNPDLGITHPQQG